MEVIEVIKVKHILNTNIMCTHLPRPYICRLKNTPHIGIKRENTRLLCRKTEDLVLCKREEDLPDLQSEDATTEVKVEEHQ
jgi:hypothetical protein